MKNPYFFGFLDNQLDLGQYLWPAIFVRWHCWLRSSGNYKLVSLISKIFLSRLWRRLWKAATLGRMASPEVNVAALGSSGSRGELSEFESLSGVLRGWKKKVGSSCWP
jgi:hypothetical protein